jgi:hypothetical protein
MAQSSLGAPYEPAHSCSACAGACRDRRGTGSGPGAIYILPPERVHPVDVPFTVALKVFSKWGTGAGEFVRAMQAAKPSQAASSAA